MSCFVPVVMSRISFLVSSSSRSSHRQMSSIFCFSAFRSVSFEFTPRKNPMLASCCELYFSIFRNARFARSVSIIPPVELYRDPYLI